MLWTGGRRDRARCDLVRRRNAVLRPRRSSRPRCCCARASARLSAPASSSPAPTRSRPTLFAVGTSWSMAHVLVTRGHVRIDALYGRFGPRVRALLDIFALLVLGHLRGRAARARVGRGLHQLCRGDPLQHAACACRWPGRSCPGSPASRCSSSRWCSRSCVALAALLRGDYAAAAAHRRCDHTGRGDRERARRPRHPKRQAGPGS